LETEQDDEGSPPGIPDITVTPSKRQDLLEVLSAYKHVQASGTLHTLTFVTVNDYLWLLRAVSQELSVLGRSGMYYLAAAVSDFFLPRRRLVRDRLSRVNTFSTTAIFSQSTRFNQAKAACISRWIKFPRF
jgi:phosphopantothenate-cysteine ligase